MTNIYERARLYALRSGKEDLAEDFSQWLALRHLEGKSLKQTVEHSFIDFLRAHRKGEVSLTYEVCGAETASMWDDIRDQRRGEMLRKAEYMRRVKAARRGPRGVIG